MDHLSTQVAVIGGGPAGYAAAFMAADLGLQVAHIDTEVNPGGVCLYRGCIPSKALLHVAKLINEVRHAPHWGVTYSEPQIDLDKLRAYKDGVVAKLTGGTGQLGKSRKINYIRGWAKFQDERTLQVAKTEGGELTLTFAHAILASGSRPAMLPFAPKDSPHVWDSTAGLELREIPQNLLIIGGGYIGLEMGTVYAALGSRITVVEMLPGLLPGADRDLVKYLAANLEKSFARIMLNTGVASMQDTDGGIKVGLKHPDGTQTEEVFDKALISIGRKPNSQNLGLENTRVQIDPKGFVKVDGQRRTAAPTIFAVGDVAGEPMLAHKGSHEGRVAAEVIAGKKVVFEPQAIPGVVFTDPEVAWCGLTEAEAEAAKRPIKVARFPWAASGRALSVDRTDGMTKLIVDPETDRILGVGIVGAGAGELIAEGTLAIEMGAITHDIGLTIHPHPTLSETLMEAADVLHGTCTHLYRPVRK